MGEWPHPALVLMTLSLLLISQQRYCLADDDDGEQQPGKEKDPPPVTEEKAKEYLQKYGYIGPSHILSASQSLRLNDFDDVKSLLRSAVKKFQEFAGLEETGELDESTRKKMAQPRCGVNDVQRMNLDESDDQAFKWDKSRLTYSLHSLPHSLDSRSVKSAIRRAFEVWLVAIPIDIVELEEGDESADINVLFARGTHGDPWPFDGRGGVLAHATLPKDGKLHFDDAERWVYMDAERLARYGYTDLLSVAVHEIGHVLGLYHSRSTRSIMAPFPPYREPLDWRGNYVVPRLDSSDIVSIQDLYGSRSRTFKPVNPPHSFEPRNPALPRSRHADKHRGAGIWDDAAGEFTTDDDSVGGDGSAGRDGGLGSILDGLLNSRAEKRNTHQSSDRDHDRDSGRRGIETYRYGNVNGGIRATTSTFILSVTLALFIGIAPFNRR